MTKKSSIAIATLASCAALAAAVVAMPSAAQAFQTGLSDRPVCFNSPGDYGVGRLCNYETIAQCQETARGINGSCEINPWFARGDEPPQYPVRRRVPRGY